MRTLMDAVKQAKSMEEQGDEIVRGVADKRWIVDPHYKQPYVMISVPCVSCGHEHRHGVGKDDGFPYAVIKRREHCGEKIIIVDLSNVN